MSLPTTALLMATQSFGADSVSADFGDLLSRAVFVLFFSLFYIVLLALVELALPRTTRRGFVVRACVYLPALVALNAFAPFWLLGTVQLLLLAAIPVALLVRAVATLRARSRGTRPAGAPVIDPPVLAGPPATPSPDRSGSAANALGWLADAAALLAGGLVAVVFLDRGYHSGRLVDAGAADLISFGRFARGIVELALIFFALALLTQWRRRHWLVVTSAVMLPLLALDWAGGAAGALAGLLVAGSAFLVALGVALPHGNALERIVDAAMVVPVAVLPTPVLLLPGALALRDTTVAKSGVAPRRKVRSPLFILGIQFIFVVGGLAYFGWRSPLAVAPTLGAMFLAALLGSGAAVTAGRLVACRRAGLPVAAAAFGPLLLRRWGGRWRVGWHQSWMLVLGEVTVAPRPGTDPTADLVRVERAAGVGLLAYATGMAGTLAVLGAAELVGDVPVVPGVWVMGCAVAAFAAAVLQQRRFRYHRALLEDPGPAGRRVRALIGIAAAAEAGARPRDWSPALVADATALPDGSLVHATGCLHAYAAAVDRGDAGSAEGWIAAAFDCAEVRAAVGSPLRAALALEGAFVTARFGGNLAEARQLLELGSAVWTEPHRRARAEAAVLLAEGAAVAGKARMRQAAEAARWWGDGAALALDEALQAMAPRAA